MTEDIQTEDELTENELTNEQTGNLQVQTRIFSLDVSGRGAENPAVALCCAAYTKSFLATLAKDSEDEVCARLDGEEAYRKAMPPLQGSRNTRDFITCIAHGVLVDAIDNARAARLLCAAKVAHAMSRSKSRKQKSASGTK